MIPSNRWFPRGLPERAAWYANFSVNFADVAASLGLTDDVVWVTDDNDVMQFLADSFVQVTAFQKAVRQYRILITEAAEGSDTPQFPKNPTFALPKVISAGMFERLDNLRTRIMAANGYTDEIGALLGIMLSKTDAPSPDTLKPVATISNIGADYKMTVHATRMGKAGYQVQIRRMNSEKWEDIKFSTTADVVVQIAPTVEGQPERIQVRVILFDKNEPVGEPSDSVYATINP